MTWQVIKRGKVVATVTADVKLDAQVTVAEKFGDGAWLLPKS